MVNTERFWSKVNKTNTCWLWTGASNHGGYGILSLGGRAHIAHRLSFEMHTGKPVPAGKMICHRCDTPACVNPAHLYAGTAATNAADRRKRVKREVVLPKKIARLIRVMTFDLGEGRALIRRIRALKPAIAAALAVGEEHVAANQAYIDAYKKAMEVRS